MRVISFSGMSGSGKDTVYSRVKELLEKEGYKVGKLSFAKPLKAICATAFRWDEERLQDDFEYKEGGLGDDLACQLLGMTRREVMQKIGTEAFRDNFHNDVWVILARLALANGDFDDYDFLVITDCRFLNELTFVRDIDGVRVRVDAVNEDGSPVVTTTNSNHYSEHEWRNYTEWDAVLLNRFMKNKQQSFNLLDHNIRSLLLPLLLRN